jgi:hypothetical protein
VPLGEDLVWYSTYVTQRILLIVLVPLCIYALVTAFLRFIVANDYTVEYEGACDPVAESCFVGCVDEECSEVYYHTWIQKQASDVYAMCGPSVLECEEASTCVPGDDECTVTYCSAETVLEDEICDALSASSIPEEPLEEEEPEREEEPAEESTEEPTPV